MKPLFVHLKPFLYALLFLLMVEALLALTPLNRVVENMVENPLVQKFYELQAKNPKHLDVLALGTSRTNNGFSPQAFEKAFGHPVYSYNMGLPATRHGPLACYLMDHIARYGKPKLVLLEVSDFMLNPAFYSYNSTLYYQALTDHNPWLILPFFKTPLLSLSDKKHVLLSAVSRLFRYRTVLSPLYLREVMLNKLPAKPIIFQGWEPREIDRRMQTKAGIQNSAENEKQFALSDFKQLDTSQLKYLLDYCKQNHIRVVLVEWPNHPAYEKLFRQSEQYNAFHQSINTLAQHYQIPLIDLNKDIPENKNSLFANTRHLSKAGAVFFTGVLAEKLGRTQILPEDSVK